MLQNEKEVSNKDHSIAAKEKTMRNTRRELSDKRRGDEDNEANLQQLVSAKNNGNKRKLKRIIVERHSYILTTTNSSRTTRSSQEYPIITRVRYGGIEFVLI